MGLILLLVVLVLLFGGGGFYLGAPYHYYGARDLSGGRQAACHVIHPGRRGRGLGCRWRRRVRGHSTAGARRPLPLPQEWISNHCFVVGGCDQR